MKNVTNLPKKFFESPPWAWFWNYIFSTFQHSTFNFDEVNLFTPVQLNVEKLAKSRLDPSVNDFQTPWSCSKPSKK
jgi:hypothetical protein